MKKGWKAGWIIAGVAAVTGGMFCIAGVAAWRKNRYN